MKRTHLVIMSEPYLSELLDGKKTIEARFSKNKCAPFEQVSVGDELWIKKVGGPIVGEAEVAKVGFYANLNPKIVKRLFEENPGLLARDDFISLKLDSRYGTLIWPKNAKKVEPREFEKKDRRGWIVLPVEGKNPGLEKFARK